jgi:Spy/CpxP family protein refolding chaperone
MRRLTAVLSFLIVSTFAVSPGVAEPAGADSDDKAGGGPKAAQRGPARTAERQQDGNVLWWNEAAIQKALAITDEQRQKMDAFLAAYREQLPAERRPAAFHETLVQGTWKQAREENGKLSALAGKAVQTRGELKINVLSVLSKEQHQKLVDQYPRLIYKPWMRAMRGSSAR